MGSCPCQGKLKFSNFVYERQSCLRTPKLFAYAEADKVRQSQNEAFLLRNTFNAEKIKIKKNILEHNVRNFHLLTIIFTGKSTYGKNYFLFKLSFQDW